MISNKEGLEWLKKQFEMSGNAFRNAESYKIMKEELQKRGNWKNKPRGKPNIDNLLRK